VSLTLKPYGEYKASGLSWIRRLPAHWKTERAKWLFERMQRPARPEDDVVTCFRDGMVTLRKNRRMEGFTESLKEIGYQGVREGDLVIHAMDAFAGAIGVSDSDGKSTPVYAVCAPRTTLDIKYYARVVREMARSQWIAALARGIRERSTDFRYENFANEWLPLPLLDEQASIAAFLGGFEKRIGKLIRAKRRVIGLLNEQRQAIIHRAVTRGIGVGVRLKSSGIDRVGDIPAHWELRRAKQVCRAIIDCKNRTPDMVEGGDFTVVRTSNVRGGRFISAGSYPTDRRNYEIWTQRGAPGKGDVFFTREAPAGEACLVPDIENLCMGQRMMYFRPDVRQLDSAFLLYSIYGPLVRTYVEQVTNGSTVGHLRLGDVYALPILWCPVEEQRAIVAHVPKCTEAMDRAIDRTAREISLVREYRARLIADVVTGKLDVRSVDLAQIEDTDMPEELDEVETNGIEDSIELDAAKTFEGEV